MATRTAAQRRAEAKEAYNAFLEGCPSRQFLETLSDKWVCLVVNALAVGAQRHSELAREIGGVSQKMLTQTLRGLERDGMVSRHVTAAVPVRVDYRLTDFGRSLLPVMAAIKGWAEANMATVHANRRGHDARQARAAHRRETPHTVVTSR